MGELVSPDMLDTVVIEGKAGGEIDNGNKIIRRGTFMGYDRRFPSQFLFRSRYRGISRDYYR